MDRPIRWYDYLTINANWFALTARSQTLTPLIIPLLVQQFAGESAKGTYVGIIRLGALMIALLAQALVGLLSDRSTSQWGRRRPFIAVGTISEIVIFAAIGMIAGLDGMDGYWLLFCLYVLSMIASNTSHAATQGLIPDLIPDEKKGLFSGVKALLELPLPLVFVSFVIGQLIASGELWAAIIILSVSMLLCMVLTMFVPEKPSEEPPSRINWEPFIRLVLMTIAFTIIILVVGAGVQAVISFVQNLSENAAKILVAVTGLAGMGIAVLLGVWISVRISLGDAFQKNKSFTWWVINRLTFLIAAFNLAGFLIFFLQERFQAMGTEEVAEPAALIIMFVGIFILITAVPSGWLSDRLGKKPLLVISSLLAAFGAAMVVSAPDLNLIKVGGCFIGAGAGFFYSVNWALGTSIVPAGKAGQYLGISNLAGAGAGAIGAYIGGPIADNQSFVLLMGIYGGLFLLSLLPLFMIEEMVPKRI